MCPGSCAESLCADCRKAARDDKRDATDAAMQRARNEQLGRELEAAKREAFEATVALKEMTATRDRDARLIELLRQVVSESLHGDWQTKANAYAALRRFDEAERAAANEGKVVQHEQR